MRTLTMKAQRRALQIDREQQEERERVARAITLAAENSESQSKSQSSTYRSNGTAPKIFNPFPPPMGPPFGTTEKYVVVPWGSTVGQGE